MLLKQVELENLNLRKNIFNEFKEDNIFDNEIFIYKIEDTKNEIKIFDIENNEIKTYKDENDFYLISNERNFYLENKFKQFSNDQIIYFGKIENNEFIIFETICEGGFCIVENENDLKHFKEWFEDGMEFVLEYSKNNKKKINLILCNLENNRKIKEISFPFIIKWEM